MTVGETVGTEIVNMFTIGSRQEGLHDPQGEQAGGRTAARDTPGKHNLPPLKRRWRPRRVAEASRSSGKSPNATVA